MSTKKMITILTTLLLATVLLSACAGEPGSEGAQGVQGPEGPQGSQGEQGPALTTANLTCTECHNETTIITGKRIPWETSAHGAGTSAAYAGTRGDCAGCHSGGAFQEMVATGMTPATFEGSSVDVTHQDCRTCHEIHMTYTADDWVLTTNAPVELYAFEDVTFDGGQGNLCGVCHMPRRQVADADAEGNIEVTSTHWGPHHGPQTAMLLGVGGAGDVEGMPSQHYFEVEDTCVTCHLGERDDHSFESDIASCAECHEEIEDFDLNGLQTDVDALILELGELLEAKGLYSLEEGHPVVGIYPAAEAQALWNYIYIAVEDASRGLHNPIYTKDLLEASIEAFK